MKSPFFGIHPLKRVNYFYGDMKDAIKKIKYLDREKGIILKTE